MADWADGRAARGEIAESTHKGQAPSFRSFAGFVGEGTDVRDVTTEHIEAWLVSQQYLKPSTRNTKAAPVRAFFRWAAERRIVERDPARPVRRARTPVRPLRRVPPEQVTAVLAAAPLRERVMVLVMVQTMIRVGELAGLRVEDWDAGHRRLLVRGKGDRWRHVSVPAEAARALEAWLDGGPAAGPMWPSTHRPGQGLTVSAVRRAVDKVAGGVGLHITPHQYRHTGAGDAVAAGAALPAVQRQLGHSSLLHTGVYVAATDAELDAAVGGRTYRSGGDLAGAAARKQRRRRRPRPRPRR